MHEINLPPRPMSEERSLMAERIKQTHDMLEMTSRNSNKLFAGASAMDYTRVWEQTDGPSAALRTLAENLTKKQPRHAEDQDYIRNGLTGSSGELKRNFLDRQRDEALRYLRPDNNMNIALNLVSRKDLKAGGEAPGEYFEGAATLVKSLVPGGEQVVVCQTTVQVRGQMAGS
jgi:hypothetical protein